ncbi:MAG: hypothetical protein A2Y45_09080 [Tenericutes bacterium GWC2_34_14]|nr:MAG: hypothetical protein A2Z84_03010 [Tenericutes bacterium GWA2_35_7]OHE30039.1 MAG: hypothetical protein A2Y45_09080 [Tenericutes bacterium GWC2_34_14]OHE35018.1 MAG: hypothetical protein A2012_02690 [Tenericutes bacterium GWE2_34_108]OHE37122.1 MAG: hypothetical protein A2Y46_00320 [Tenericutes bacterium GWF1_35_14]OHE39746.1 MAG: hypothetical protein A2Y44_02540 [Tenericutes bacterium GWF2_35_184]OHE44000.1 MAG: hypothetical protein A3K26_07310 [Tenericutes bacterium RIFOXYA12_FULL_35_
MINLLGHCKTIGIVGLAKNTGKTTTLNYLIQNYQHQILGLTSIGLDGEEIDQVNFLPKPRIKVFPGMVVATSAECLNQTDVSFQVIKETSFQTALGKVFMVKALTEGFIMLAGPTTNKELNQLIEMMKLYTDMIFVDGALSRMTFSAISELDGIVLATGAAFSEEMSETIMKTEHVIKTFSYDLTQRDINDKFSFFAECDHESYPLAHKKYEEIKGILHQIKDRVKWVYIKGAITEKMIQMFIDLRINHFELVIDDPAKLLFHHHYADVFDKLHIHVTVRKKCPLVLITVNPYRPVGTSYDPFVFEKMIKALTDINVINVKRVEVNNGK